jgi:hypothetical protein
MDRIIISGHKLSNSSIKNQPTGDIKESIQPNITCVSQNKWKTVSTETRPTSSDFIKDIESNVRAFKLEAANIQYIIVVNGRDGDVAITKHK